MREREKMAEGKVAPVAHEDSPGRAEPLARLSRKGRFLLPAFLAGLWLLLNDSLEAAHLVLALLLAFFLDRAIRRLRPLPAAPRRFWLSLQLIGRVFADIVRSNFAVGGIILGTARRQPTIGFMDIPLELTHPHGLAMLSIIITSTLGAVGQAGVPGPTLLVVAVLVSANIPIDALPILFGVDRIFDMLRTSVNITGDAACATIVDQFREEA